MFGVQFFTRGMTHLATYARFYTTKRSDKLAFQNKTIHELARQLKELKSFVLHMNNTVLVSHREVNAIKETVSKIQTSAPQSLPKQAKTNYDNFWTNRSVGC